IPAASTFTGILPTAWVASAWKMIPFSLASFPIAAMSWIVPISLFANMTEMRIVLSVIASRIASSSTKPSVRTGTYVISKPCRSRRLQTSRLARCSMTVVTMWLPFSRYISTTPFIARLIDSVPPEVKTTSLGSRAPMILASCSRARSTPASASQPNERLRLAAWPNFSVKYGIIASTTCGSAGVVDCASMKIGNFSAICLSPSLLTSRDRQHFGRVLVGQLGQAHGIEQPADRRLELLHGPSQVATRLLRAAAVVETAHDADRALERPHDLTDGDVTRMARQHVPALGAILTGDQAAFGQTLQDLREEFLRNPELLGDPLGTDSTELVVDGDIMNRHQAVIGALGKAEHRLLTLVPVKSLVKARSLLPTNLIGDLFSRILTPASSDVNRKGLR